MLSKVMNPDSSSLSGFHRDVDVKQKRLIWDIIIFPLTFSKSFLFLFLKKRIRMEEIRTKIKMNSIVFSFPRSPCFFAFNNWRLASFLLEISVNKLELKEKTILKIEMNFINYHHGNLIIQQQEDLLQQLKVKKLIEEIIQYS